MTKATTIGLVLKTWRHPSSFSVPTQTHGKRRQLFLLQRPPGRSLARVKKPQSANSARRDVAVCTVPPRRVVGVMGRVIGSPRVTSSLKLRIVSMA